MKNKYFILIIAVIIAAAAGVIIYKRTRLSIGEMRKYLQNADGEFRPGPFDQMSDQEVKDSYTFMKAYAVGKTSLPADLLARIAVISAKYKIFT